MTDLVIDTLRKHNRDIRKSDFNSLRLRDIIESGFEASTAEAIAEMINLPFSDFLNYLPIRRATYYSYKREHKKLNKIVSDYLFQILLLIAYGQQVFEDKDLFREWLYSTSYALGNQRPIDLLNSHFGINMVQEELDRIEYGIY